MSRVIARLGALSACVLVVAHTVLAASVDGGAPAAPNAAPSAAASAAPAGSANADASNGENCVERIPAGKERPKFTEKIAARAVSGHALTLDVVVEHGKGETVLPTGFHLLSDSPEAKALEREGFALPDAEGAAGPRLERVEQGERATTTVHLSVVPLPPKPGRHEMILPPLPIAVSRASGELVTVCTAPHGVLVEDPIASVPNPAPKGNPAARRQLEIWTAAKHVAFAALVALIVGALAALLISRWLRRPKKLPPPPPPRPPWDVALEALHDIRHAGLTGEGRFAEVFDRVSDVLRRYLGDRYGYDGLESTTREALGSLCQITPQIEDLSGIETFMRDADLVKFARLTPSEGECIDLMARAENIVTRTIAIAPVAAPLMTESASGESAAADSDENHEPPDLGGAP
ncbi:MAG TPA: hypothetical protein VHW01_10425 [Polyangiaceae bacterium]|jgi:hypothetical protein|nr:hypothetical protein [Polyangiaceae bacterium]